MSSPGLITAAFKLKRKALENKYQDDIAEMYAGNNNVGNFRLTVVNSDSVMSPFPSASNCFRTWATRGFRTPPGLTPYTE